MLLFTNMTYFNKRIGFVKVKWPQRLKFYSIVLIHCKFQFKKANFFFAYKADTISSFEYNNGFLLLYHYKCTNKLSGYELLRM